MAWLPAKKEIDAVLKLEAPQRYSYWIKKIADSEQVWSLWQPAGWALAVDTSGRQLVPVWPHQSMAQLCAVEQWQGYDPRSISLDDWLERWIPGMLVDHRLVAAFPTPNNQGISVDPQRVREDLLSELEKY